MKGITMKKFFQVFLLSLVCLVTMEYANVLAQEHAAYQYEENGDGITITGYSGTDQVLNIPEEIDGNKVTVIGAYAFSEKPSLEKVTVPSTIKRIEKGAFSQNESLSCIKIEKSNDGHGIRIESLAMADCPVLSSLALPKNVTYIADDFVARSAEKSYLYVETEHDAAYVLDRLRSGGIQTGTDTVIQPVTEGLDEPQNIRCRSYGDNQITVEWNHVAGARAYQVFRKIVGKYQLVATVEENSFTEDYVVNNRIYLYRIKAVGSVYGKPETVSAATGYHPIGKRIPDVRNIHAVALNKNAVTLVWNSHEAIMVDGYNIYQKTGNSWKKIKQVKGTPYPVGESRESTTIGGLSCGKNYTFAVQSYCYDKWQGNLYSCSEYTTYTTTALVRPSTTYILKIRKYPAYHQVQWEFSEDASGYLVYRSTSKNGKYKKIAVIRSGSKLYYNDRNIRSGKKYYYKIVVYRNVNGKKIKSKASTAVAIK